MTTATKSTTAASCAKCVFWKNIERDSGECRRHAPQTVVFNVDQDLKFESRFPRTQGEDWCGDFKASMP